MGIVIDSEHERVMRGELGGVYPRSDSSQRQSCAKGTQDATARLTALGPITL